MQQIQDDRFWKFAAQEWHRLYSPYVPMQTGNLVSNVSIEPKQITHNVPYAFRQYNGQFKFRKDKHPLACGKWDVAAKPSQESKLLNTLQNYIESGRLQLND